MPTKRCASCDQNIGSRQRYIDCNACIKPYHEQCCDLEAAEFEVCFKKKSALKWFCRVCDPQVTDLLSNFEKFKKVNIAIENIRNEFRTEIDQKMQEFETRVRKCEKIESNPAINSVIKKVVDESLPMQNHEEEKLIERKKNNLIYFKIPEINSESIEARIRHDFERLKDINGEDNIDAQEISNVFRVGKKSETARPLIVKFKDQITKEKYIERTFGKKLTVKKGHEIIEIGVTHDRTEKQRTETKRK